MTSNEVVAETGVTYRQLVHWSMSGWIPGQPVWVGSGYQRDWSRADVDRVIEIRDAIAASQAILEAAGIGGYRRPPWVRAERP